MIYIFCAILTYQVYWWAGSLQPTSGPAPEGITGRKGKEDRRGNNVRVRDEGERAKELRGSEVK